MTGLGKLYVVAVVGAKLASPSAPLQQILFNTGALVSLLSGYFHASKPIGALRLTLSPHEHE
jgi:hypothetical protein